MSSYNQILAGDARDGKPVGRPAFAATQHALHNGTTITSGGTAVTAASGKTVRLMTFDFSISAAANVVFKRGSTELYRTPKLAADTPYTVILGAGHGILADAAGNITATSSAAADLTGTIGYVEQ